MKYTKLTFVLVYINREYDFEFFFKQKINDYRFSIDLVEHITKIRITHFLSIWYIQIFYAVNRSTKYS